MNYVWFKKNINQISLKLNISVLLKIVIKMEGKQGWEKIFAKYKCDKQF